MDSNPLGANEADMEDASSVGQCGVKGSGPKADSQLSRLSSWDRAALRVEQLEDVDCAASALRVEQLGDRPTLRADAPKAAAASPAQSAR